MRYIEKIRLMFNMKTNADVLLRTAQNLAVTVDNMVDSGMIPEDCDLHDQAHFYIEVACDLVKMFDDYASEDELIEIERRVNNKYDKKNLRVKKLKKPRRQEVFDIDPEDIPF